MHDGSKPYLVLVLKETALFLIYVGMDLMVQLNSLVPFEIINTSYL